MSSRENRASWNEVILSPETENEADIPVRQEPGEVSSSTPEAQEEGEPK